MAVSLLLGQPHWQLMLVYSLSRPPCLSADLHGDGVVPRAAAAGRLSTADCLTETTTVAPQIVLQLYLPSGTCHSGRLGSTALQLETLLESRWQGDAIPWECDRCSVSSVVAALLCCWQWVRPSGSDSSHSVIADTPFNIYFKLPATYCEI